MRAESGVVAKIGVAPRAVAVGLGYGLVAYFCLSFSRFGAPVESIWISNALLVAALLKVNRGSWPIFIVCAALGHVAAHLSTGDAPGFSIAFLTGDMSEAVLCAGLLGWRPRTLAFQNRGAIFYFLGVCTASALISAAATGAATALWGGRLLKAEDFIIWFCADALALVIFVPLFFGFSEARWRKLSQHLLEVTAILTVIIACNLVASADPRLTPLRFLVLPAMVIAAFDLGVVGVEIGMAVLFAVWVGLALVGLPPTPWVHLDMRGDLVVAQLLLAMLAATILPLAVVLEERQRLNTLLSDSLKETQEAWGAVIGAEARYRLVVDNVSETVMRVDRDGVIQFASAACGALLHDEHLKGQTLLSLLHPQDGEAMRERLDECLHQGLANLSHRWACRIGVDDIWRSIDLRVTLVAPGGVGREEFVVVMAPREPWANSP